MSTGEHTKHITFRSQTRDDCQLSPHCLRSCCLWLLSITSEIPCVCNSVSASRRVQDKFYNGKRRQEQRVLRQPDLCTPGPGAYSHSMLLREKKKNGRWCFLLLSNGQLGMYLSISFHLNLTPDHLGFAIYLPHPVFLLSTSTSLFCSLLQQHCTLQYSSSSSWNLIAFLISLFSLFFSSFVFHHFIPAVP